MVKKNILDSKPTANKKCDLISVPKKTADMAGVVRSAGPGGAVCGSWPCQTLLLTLGFAGTVPTGQIGFSNSNRHCFWEPPWSHNISEFGSLSSAFNNDEDRSQSDPIPESEQGLFCVFIINYISPNCLQPSLSWVEMKHESMGPRC